MATAIFLGCLYIADMLGRSKQVTTKENSEFWKMKSIGEWFWVFMGFDILFLIALFL